MPVCSFCKKNFKEQRGLTVFTFDGRSVHYCSGKCRKNFGLGRDSKKVNWIRKEKKIKTVEQIKKPVEKIEKPAEKPVEKKSIEEKSEKIEKTEKPVEKKEEKKEEKK